MKKVIFFIFLAVFSVSAGAEQILLKIAAITGRNTVQIIYDRKGYMATLNKVFKSNDGQPVPKHQGLKVMTVDNDAKIVLLQENCIVYKIPVGAKKLNGIYLLPADLFVKSPEERCISLKGIDYFSAGPGEIFVSKDGKTIPDFPKLKMSGTDLKEGTFNIESEKMTFKLLIGCNFGQK